MTIFTISVPFKVRSEPFPGLKTEPEKPSPGLKKAGNPPSRDVDPKDDPLFELPPPPKTLMALPSVSVAPSTIESPGRLFDTARDKKPFWLPFGLR